jgi:hypothetical protein
MQQANCLSVYMNQWKIKSLGQVVSWHLTCIIFMLCEYLALVYLLKEEFTFKMVSLNNNHKD